MGIQFISSLQVGGGTKLYDNALYARNWLQQNLRKDAINAVLILTDGDDSESNTNLEQLAVELKKVVFLQIKELRFLQLAMEKKENLILMRLKKLLI